jgi:hypothetical protein
VRLGPLATSAAIWPTVAAPDDDDDDDDDECGGVGVLTGRGNRSTRRKHSPVPHSPPHIPHDLTRARTRGCRDGKPTTNCLSYGTIKK